MIKNLFRSGLLLGFILFLFASKIMAGNPDSGSILSEQRGQNIQNFPSGFPGSKIYEQPELQADDAITVTVKIIEFTGYEGLVDISELDRIAHPYLNKELTFAQLQTLAQLITKYLREEKGFVLSRAYLPEQDITDGTLIISIIAGRLEGKVKVHIDGPHRINQHLLEQISQSSLPEDDMILLDDLERAVLLINDLPGISARAYLDKGETPGTSAVTLDVKEGPWLSTILSGDNFGNRYTGRFRRIAQVGLYDVLGKGDLFTLAYTNADELNQGKVGVSLPIGGTGAFWDASYNGLRYELGGKLEDLRANGTANTWSTGIRYPLKRTKKTSLWLGARAQYDALEDRLDKLVTSDRGIAAGTLGMSGNFFDTLFGGGLTSFSMDAHTGDVEITDGKSSDDSGAGTGGKYFKFTYTFARLQRIIKNFSLFLSARGQFADNNLDSSQKMILGGPTGVRAYPVGESSGDEGHIFTVEKRYDMPFNSKKIKTQLVGFFDAGHIRLHENTWTNSVTNISGRNHYWLTGVGAALNFEQTGTYRIQFSYAHKIGKNPGRDFFNNDADNRSDSGRFWVQATVWF